MKPSDQLFVSPQCTRKRLESYSVEKICDKNGYEQIDSKLKKIQFSRILPERHDVQDPELD